MNTFCNGQKAPAGYGYFWWIRPNHSYEAVGIFGQSVPTSETGA